LNFCMTGLDNIKEMVRKSGIKFFLWFFLLIEITKGGNGVKKFPCTM